MTECVLIKGYKQSLPPPLLSLWVSLSVWISLCLSDVQCEVGCQNIPSLTEARLGDIELGQW